MASQEIQPPHPSDVLDLEKNGAETNNPPSAPVNNMDHELHSENKEEEALAASQPPAPAQTKEPEWAHGFQLVNILAAVTFVCFLMLLDGTIVVAAVPRITDDFNSLDDIGWYGAAYQLGRYVK